MIILLKNNEYTMYIYKLTLKKIFYIFMAKSSHKKKSPKALFLIFRIVLDKL